MKFIVRITNFLLIGIAFFKGEKAKCFWRYCTLVGVLVISSCNLQKHIPDDKTLLNKVEVKKAPKGHEYNLESLVKQKPNSRFLGIYRFNMWTYLIFDGEEAKQDSIVNAKWFLGKFWKKTKRSIRKNIGEKPVYLDSTLVMESSEQMISYLNNQGYFGVKVKNEIKVKNEKAKVSYIIQAGKPYRIKELEYHIQDRYIDSLIRSNKEESLLAEGMIYSSEALRKERDRIANYLNNEGFFNFTKEYITFDVDTSVGQRKVRVGISITNPKTYERHRKYRIRDIYIEPYHQQPDTAEKDTFDFKGYKFIFQKGNRNFHLPSLLRKVTIEPKELYSLKDKQETYNNLSQLEIFKFIDIRYMNPVKQEGNEGYIDCYIQLTPRDKRAITLEFELTTTEENQQFASTINTSRYYGFAPTLTYSNKNFLRRGIIWDMSLRGAYEFSNEWFEKRLDQNIYEFGASSSINYFGSFLPRFVFKKPPSKTINTSVEGTYLIEGNPDYQRATISGGYTWRFDNPLSSVFVTPFSVNLVNTNIKKDTFARQVEQLGNPFIESIFDQYMIPSGKLSWVYNDQPIKGAQHWLIRWSIEPSGNLLYLLKEEVGPYLQRNVFNETPSEHEFSETFQHSFGDIGFYTFTKTVADFRYYIPGNKENMLALRFSPGIGFAYGNNEFMPFEKRFFVGGSNSIRAWAVREIGPGSYSGETTGESAGFDRLFQVGDILLEGNIEYRFDMFYRFKGALFTDFGNVWTLKEEQNKPGGQIEQDFYKEIAIGSGVGLRLDFTFFIFRLDFGWPIRNPQKPMGQRWVDRDIHLDWVWNKARWNIGIGYPF